MTTLSVLGCQDSSEKSSADALDAAPRDAQVADVAVVALDGTQMTDAVALDADTVDAAVQDRGTADVGTADVGQSDADPTLQIDDCAAACARVEACDRDDIFGADGCLPACENASRAGPPTDWFHCLEVEACNLLHRCRLPDPPPLDCDQVCAVVDQCGVDLPFADCAEECMAQNGTGAYSECAELLYGRRCDTEAFWECLGRRVYSACAERCALAARCNLVEGAGCLQACITEGRAPDPLARFRATERNECFSDAAMSCHRARDCLEPERWVPVMPTMENLCRLWNECYAPERPCESVEPIFLSFPLAIACVIGELGRGCPEDSEAMLLNCLQNVVPVGPGCHELCRARALCGDLPPPQDAMACQAECAQLQQSRREDERWLLQQRFACSQANLCEELIMCLAPLRPEAP